MPMKCIQCCLCILRRFGEVQIWGTGNLAREQLELYWNLYRPRADLLCAFVRQFQHHNELRWSNQIPRKYTYWYKDEFRRKSNPSDYWIPFNKHNECCQKQVLDKRSILPNTSHMVGTCAAIRSLLLAFINHCNKVSRKTHSSISKSVSQSKRPKQHPFPCPSLLVACIWVEHWMLTHWLTTHSSATQFPNNHDKPTSYSPCNPAHVFGFKGMLGY